MKKFLEIIIAFMCVICICVSLDSCSSCSHDVKPATDTTAVDTAAVDFNKVLVSDYDIVVATQKDPTVNVYYFESQIELNKTVADTSAEKPVVMKYTNVFQAGDTVWQFTHYAALKCDTVVKNIGPWLEDVKIDINSITVSLDSALTKLSEANIVKPASNKVVLRNPLGPTVKPNAMYIFGQQNTGFVSVDVKTAEVNEVK